MFYATLSLPVCLADALWPLTHDKQLAFIAGEFPAKFSLSVLRIMVICLLDVSPSRIRSSAAGYWTGVELDAKLGRCVHVNGSASGRHGQTAESPHQLPLDGGVCLEDCECEGSLSRAIAAEKAAGGGAGRCPWRRGDPWLPLSFPPGGRRCPTWSFAPPHCRLSPL